MKTTPLFAILGLAAAAGCANSTDALHTKLFDQVPQTEARTHSTYEAMAAAAVREDATLQVTDFTGVSLSPAGMKKLEVLMPSTADDDVTVYVNVPSNKLTDARRDAVAKYYADAGVSSAHIAVELGANPNQHNPAGVGMAGLAKQAAADPAADTSGARGAGVSAK